MIFKIGHICYCGDRRLAETTLATLGYRQLLSDRISTRSNTRHLLSSSADDYRLSIFELAGSISLEILEFENHSANEGLVRPIIETAIAGEDIADNVDGFLNPRNLGLYPASFLGFPAYTKAWGTRQEFAFNSFVIASSNIDESVQFWKQIGFHTVNRFDEYCKLRFRCMFSGKYYYIYLYLDRRKVFVREDLDSLGFHVLGLISTSIKQEIEKMRMLGIECTSVENICVRGRELSVFYARAPEGLIVEFVSLN